MMLASLPIVAVTLFVALAPTRSSAAVCSHSADNFEEKYNIEAEGVPNIPATCGGLWDNLNHFGTCAGYVHYAECGETNGHLRWRFNTNRGCQPGMVESAWYEETKNAFGSIDCGDY